MGLGRFRCPHPDFQVRLLSCLVSQRSWSRFEEQMFVDRSNRH
jgi:hypothetical protein